MHLKTLLVKLKYKLINLVKRIKYHLVRSWQKKSSLPPILIYQPGKVGSLSVKVTLEEAYKKLGQSVVIHHVHALNKLEKREEFVRATRKNPENSLSIIHDWMRLRREIDKDPQRYWKIINLVRDPVAMKVSALFQTLEQHIPSWQKDHQQGKLHDEDLRALLLSKSEFGFKGLDVWYDRQVKDLWGIDVFGEPFPSGKGYCFYQTANIHMVIIRLEDLNRVAGEVFDRLLGLKDVKMVNANISEEKSYAQLYTDFKSRPLPEEYVNTAYRTHFARHFYTPYEIAKFREKWLAQGK